MEASYLTAAVADGWEPDETHLNNTYGRHARLTKDGWVMHIDTRNDSAMIWGPDRLQIRAPKHYDWPAMVAGLRECQYCGATDVDTERLSFAGRACKPCADKLRPEYEYPGWTN